MKEQQLDENTKAVVIEVADIFFEMDVEELPENMPEEKEFPAHVKVVSDVLKKAKHEGYKKWAFYNRAEAEARGQNLGINGVYLIVLKK